MTIVEAISRIMDNVILEDQLDYLTRKYPNLDQEIVAKAIVTSPKYAEQLIIGLQQGIINQITPDSIGQVSHINPHEKQSKKTQAHIEYESRLKEAKRISKDYCQWILRVWKDSPEQQFDESWFHYLEGNDLSSNDILDQSVEEISVASVAWHNEQFAKQDQGGQYHLGIDDAVAEYGGYWFVPVDPEDAKVEGAKMQNCIGSHVIPGQNYLVFSMRDRFNNPHVSISFYIKDKRSSEIKGKQNALPLEKYRDSASKFVVGFCKKNGYTLSNDIFRILPPELARSLLDIIGSVAYVRDNLPDLLDDWVLKHPESISNSNLDPKVLKPETLFELLQYLSDSSNPLDGPRGDDAKGLHLKMIVNIVMTGKVDPDSIKSLIEHFNISNKSSKLLNLAYAAVYNSDYFSDVLGRDKREIESVINLDPRLIQFVTKTSPLYYQVFQERQKLQEHPSNQRTQILTTVMPYDDLIKIMRDLNPLLIYEHKFLTDDEKLDILNKLLLSEQLSASSYINRIKLKQDAFEWPESYSDDPVILNRLLKQKGLKTQERKLIKSRLARLARRGQ